MKVALNAKSIYCFLLTVTGDVLEEVTHWAEF